MHRTAIGTALVCLTLLIPAAEVLAGDEKPNLLILIADDLGVDYIGAYNSGPGGEGGSPGPTHNIDNLATHGVLFRNAWVAPLCSPTRAGLLTGRHGFRTGIQRPGGVQLETREVTMAEMLASVGYSNALIGKWHLGVGNAIGGLDVVRVAGWDHYSGNPRGNLSDYFVWNKVVDGVEGPANGYATTEHVDDALSWINGQTDPWSCIVAFHAPHSPNHTPPVDLHSYGANPSVDDQYRAMIEAMDREVGRLLLGLGDDIDDTLIFFIGDNGTPNGRVELPFLHGKSSVYEGGVRVPFIVRGPGVVSPGRETDHLIHGVDLYATIAELVSADVDALAGGVAVSDSRSFLSILHDPLAASARETIYSEVEQNGGVDQTVRDARYHLLIRNGAPEFYDLQLDPYEDADLLVQPGGLTAEQQLAYEALQATLSEVLFDDCTAVRRGDMNGNGALNGDDIQMFVDCMLVGSGPNCTCGDFNEDGVVSADDAVAMVDSLRMTGDSIDCAGDMDSNGMLNGADIQGFVDCILGNGTGCTCADFNRDGIVAADDVAALIFALNDPA